MTSKYAGFVFESMNNTCFCYFDKQGNIYFSDGTTLFSVEKSGLKKFYSLNGVRFIYYFSNDGMWVTFDKDSGESFSLFVDVYDKGISYEEIPGAFSQICDDLVVTREKIEGKNILYCRNLATQTSTKKEGLESGYLSSNERKIYINTFVKPFPLYCFDETLTELWRVEKNERSYSNGDQTPHFHEDLVIINQSMDVLAFNKYSGDPVWSYSLTKMSPGSFYVANGKVYLTEIIELIILDAASGEELFRGLSGYPDRTDKYGLNSNELSMYPIGEDLVFTYCTYEPEIKFFTSDLKTCIQSLNLFEYTTYGVYGSRKPVIHENKAIIPLGNGATSTSNGQLLIRPAEEGELPEIHLMPRLPIHYYALPNLQETHKYQVYVEGEELEHVHRYAGIAIKELHYETGAIPMYNAKKGALDFKHDGHIELIVDASALADNAEQDLQQLLVDLKAYFDSDSAETSDGKHEITLSLKYIPKSDWTMQGEKLDLVEARKIGKPLNKK